MARGDRRRRLRLRHRLRRSLLLRDHARVRPPGAIPSLPAGALVSGSRDKRVIVWDPNTGALVAEFAGHDLDVTAVAVLASGAVVSGAMDKRVKIWSLDTRACVRTLEAHESSVLALLPLPSGGFLSGSADHTIRRWEGDGEAGKPVAILRGHSDTVRGLAAAPGVGFLSASHDCTARLWTHGGETATVFVGHTALVYAVAATSDGRVVTGSEDNTSRRVESGGRRVPRARFDTGVRVVRRGVRGGFLGHHLVLRGRSRARVDDERVQGERGRGGGARGGDDRLEEARARATLAEQQSKIKTEPPSALAQPGASDGATKVIEEASGSIAAYAWSAATASWERLGEVTGVGGGGGGKKEHAGVEYDFVFDVDIQEGAPTLKLPFNRGDNPYAAAELFLENNGLDPGYREQVVNFIVQNAGEDAAYQGANVDPFTGGGAYVPGAAAAAARAGRTRTAEATIRSRAAARTRPAAARPRRRRRRPFPRGSSTCPCVDASSSSPRSSNPCSRNWASSAPPRKNSAPSPSAPPPRTAARMPHRTPSRRSNASWARGRRRIFSPRWISRGCSRFAASKERQPRR